LREAALSYILLPYLKFLHKEFDNLGVLGLEYARLKLRPEPDPIARQK